MGRFRFSLQPALDVVAAREQEAAVAAGRARAAVEDARLAIVALDRRGAELARIRGDLSTAAAVSSCWIATEFFFERLRHVRAGRDRAVAAADARARDAGEAHLRARNGRLALDRLRDRRLAEHRAQEALREASDFDESNALGRKD